MVEMKFDALSLEYQGDNFRPARYLDLSYFMDDTDPMSLLSRLGFSLSKQIVDISDREEQSDSTVNT